MNAGIGALPVEAFIAVGNVTGACVNRMQAPVVFSSYSLKPPHPAPEKPCARGPRQKRTGIVMLQTTRRMRIANGRRPDRGTMAGVGTFPFSCVQGPAVHEGSMDRKNASDFTCSDGWPSGIKECRLACEFPFPNAEVVRHEGKGGAPFFRRGWQQYPASHREKFTCLTSCSLSNCVKEGGMVGSNKWYRRRIPRLPRQEAERGWMHYSQ